jgi:hypothetical protein
VLRKQAQYGEGGGALIRKNVHSFDFLRRASVILALNFTKLTLLICLFIWPLTPYAAILLLLLSAYYGRWAMLSKDWRAPLVPFAVSLMFSINALSMVRGFIQGHQSFHYHKRNK